jgi:hypothetical protein
MRLPTAHLGVALSWRATRLCTAARRGWRRVCSARNSVARPRQYDQPDRGEEDGDAPVVGMDPHKRSVTIEASDTREVLRATGTFGTDTSSYSGMMKVAHQWPDRVWAVEGANGGGPAHCATTARRRGAGAGCAGEVGRSGPGVRHRAGPQDRRPRHARRRDGGSARPGPAGADCRRRLAGAAAAL